MSRVTHHYSHEGLCESIVCTLEYEEAEPMTRDYPGSPSKMELYSATLLGHDITKAISDELAEEIEYVALIQHEEGGRPAP